METILSVNGGQKGASESSGYCNSSLSPHPMSCFKLPAATCEEINSDLRSIGKLGVSCAFPKIKDYENLHVCIISQSAS
ncbi:unnamed protein product [Prunus armeniaca]